ncbi:MAG: AI-2E family transporter [Rhodospirillaceae bacterium]|nr:AI-2E family transporter [Rhodospirillaceae bacterium]
MRSINSLTFAVLVLGSILLAGLIWAAGDILALFVIAFLLAYLFDPAADWMVRHGISRPSAALLITAGLVLVIGGLLALAGPLAYAQTEGVLRSLQAIFTETMTNVRQHLAPYMPILRPLGLGGLVKGADPSSSDISGPLASVVSGGIAFATTMGLAFLTPVVTYYLLKDWSRMRARILKEVPFGKRAMVRHLAWKIDEVLSAFLHGQAWVCLCVGVIYTAGFLVIGLQSAIVLGMVAGALKFLPYIGTVIAFLLTFATAISQSGWDGWLITGIAVTFLVGEVIESSILSPRIIGNRVQLPPALVIFAVLLGGKLFSIIGVFIAIPVFAVGRVLFEFWLHREQEARKAREKRVKPRARSPASRKMRIVHSKR